MEEALSTVVSDTEIVDSLRTVLSDVREVKVAARDVADRDGKYPNVSAMDMQTVTDKVGGIEDTLVNLLAHVAERAGVVNVEALRCVKRSATDDQCVRPNGHAGSHHAWTGTPSR